ncbi:MAG: site-2 protease family protein [Planctomycetota bacterium]
MSAIFSNQFTAIFALILGFGFLIFVHELGHFAVAKWVGIRATQFAIGFGNAIVSYRKGIGVRMGGTEKEYIARALDALKEEGKSVDGLDEHKRNQMIMEKADELGLGETEYRWNTLPLGGYVKMLGQEDMDPAAQSDDPRSFNKKSIGARAAVISAGVIMNLIFGLIFFIICFQMGVRFAAPVVGETAAGSPAAVTYARGHDGEPDFRGLQPGDKITHLDGEPITDMAEVRIATALGKGGQAVAMTVERDGVDQPLVYDIVATASEANEGLLSAGILPSQSLVVGTNNNKAADVIDGLGFAGQGLKPGMTLVAVNGKPVDHISEYRREVATNSDKPYLATFALPNSNVKTTLTVNPSPGWEISDDGVMHLLGMAPGIAVYLQEGSPAEKAGLQNGDVLKQLGEIEWPTQRRAIIDAVGDAGRQGITIEVLRGGETLRFEGVKPVKGKLGINLLTPETNLTLFEVSPDSPLSQAAAGPIPPGSKLTSVNSQEVTSWTDVKRELQTAVAHADGAVETEIGVRINLGDQPLEIHNVTIDAEQAAAVAALEWRPALGVGFEPLQVEVKADGPVDATLIGFDKTGQFVQQTYITLLRLIQGTIGVKNLRGPVGIVDEGSKVAAQGLAYYLFFLGLISVNLAVLNFLPIPIVDGGLMVFLMIEKIKGSPASPQVQTAVALVGIVGLACVFLYVTFNDISRIVMG